MKVYHCYVCGLRSPGKRTAGWYLMLILGLFMTPFLFGIIILLCLPFVSKHCPRCNAILSAKVGPGTPQQKPPLPGDSYDR